MHFPNCLWPCRFINPFLCFQILYSFKKLFSLKKIFSLGCSIIFISNKRNQVKRRNNHPYWIRIFVRDTMLYLKETFFHIVEILLNFTSATLIVNHSAFFFPQLYLCVCSHFCERTRVVHDSWNGNFPASY